MSVRVSSWVWHNSEAAGNDRLVLLAIADEANDDGADAFPSNARVARKTRLSERTVQRCVKRLSALGELIVETQAEWSDPKIRPDRRPNRYRVVMTDGMTPGRQDGIPSRGDGATPAAPRGDATVSPNPSVPEEQPPSPPPGSKRPTSKTPAPEEFTIERELRLWASSNVPDVPVDRETEKFLDHHRARGTRFSSWPAGWRTWMRNAQGYLERDGKVSPRASVPTDAGARMEKLGTRVCPLGLCGGDGWAPDSEQPTRCECMLQPTASST